MQKAKKIGIWMDHSTANIMELSNNKIETIVFKSTPAFPEQVENLRLDESLMHSKEQVQNAGFYKKLSHKIKDYNEVLLFGPTDAKTELFNLLKQNRQFEKIKISVQPADKLTKNQQEAFVKSFFNSSTK